MILFITYKVKPCSNIIPDVYIGYTKELGPGGACGDHLFQLCPLGRTRSTTIPGLWLSVAFVAAELRNPLRGKIPPPLSVSSSGDAPTSQ